MNEVQVNIERATYGILRETPGHISFNIWINGAKSGELTIRQ